MLEGVHSARTKHAGAILDIANVNERLAGVNVTFAETIALIKADVRRRLALEGRRINLTNAIEVAFKPGVVAVVAYRIITFLHLTKHGVLARILDDLQQLYTGTEIHAGSIIGPGLVLGDRAGGGISEHVTMGKNCTVLGGSTMTLNANGIDLSKGRIVIGDHCIIGLRENYRRSDAWRLQPNQGECSRAAVVAGAWRHPGWDTGPSKSGRSTRGGGALESSQIRFPT